MMAQYWRDPEATAATLVDGWLRTGDLGALDERGCLRLAGRRDEMFIRGGYNVYPEEVEGVLRSHPGVSDVAVVPRGDPLMGQIGVAVVVPADPAHTPTLDDLRAFAADRLARYKLPEAVRVVDALPLTTIHKLDRRRLVHEEEEATAARTP
jgi:acyl-CoA synthetase (AMP-forming)/AMP-acid ligase II